MTKAKILIVEDEAFFAQNLKIHLEHVGYEVLGIVASGESAVDSVAASRPDLVMMDIILEGKMDGIEAAQLIRSRFNVPVLYLTAYADEHLFQRAKITEPSAYLLKPFSERELQLTIETALYRHQMEIRLRENEAQLADERNLREVVARERAEQTLLESEDRYRSIVEASPDAIGVVADGIVVLVNSAAVKLLGVESKSEVVGTKPEDWVSPEYYEQISQRMSSVLENRIINQRMPYKLMRRDGTTVDIEAVSFAFDYMGVTSLLVMVRDVSARNKAEEMIQRFRVAIDSSADGIYLIDRPSMHFIDANDIGCSCLGYTREELFGLGPQDIKPLFSKQALEQYFDEMLRSGSSGEFIETFHKRKDHSLFPVEINVKVIKSDSGSTIVAIARDVTKRHEAEKLLRDSEEKFRQLAENIREVFWIRDDVTGQILYVSPTYETVWGRTCESLIERPRSFLSAVHPDDIERVSDTFAFHRVEGGAYDHEYRIVRPDGSVRWVWARISPVLDANGKVYRTVGMAEDITHIKLREASLEDSEERFRQLAENIQDTFWIREADFNKLIYISPAYETIWGKSRESLFNDPRSYIESIHPDDRQHVLAVLQKQQIEQVWFNEKYRLVRPDGEIRWVWSRAFPVRDAQGKIYRMAGIVSDITDRIAAEDALRESEERFRMLFEHAPVGFAIIGKDYKFIEANQALSTMLGYSQDELLSKAFGDLTYPDDLEVDLEYCRKLFSSEIPSYKLAKRYIRKNGEVFWIDLIGTVIHNEAGEPLYALAIINDVTERKQEEASRFAFEVSQRNTLVREVHHRIKNNLQGVVGLLRQHVVQHPNVKRELEAAIARINSIAMVYGLQSEDMQEQVRLCDMVCGICSSAQIMMEAIIEPIVEVDVIKPVKVTKEEAVPVALILNELIHNAIKHSRPDQDCQPIQVFMGGDENIVTVRVQNKCASLPGEFDFSTGSGLGTGLSLVKSLLPHEGAQLDFSIEPDMVCAQFVLTPPVIVSEAGFSESGLCPE